jgi:hypothetical protein
LACRQNAKKEHSYNALRPTAEVAIFDTLTPIEALNEGLGLSRHVVEQLRIVQGIAIHF